MNGAEYEGQWKEGRFHDDGELRLADGTSYDPRRKQQVFGDDKLLKSYAAILTNMRWCGILRVKTAHHQTGFKHP